MWDMALLFSQVTVTAGNDAVSFLVGGIPREYDDLEDWDEFDDFLKYIDEETEVLVHADAYLYGEGEPSEASYSDIQQFSSRLKSGSSFLTDYCDNIEEVNFSFTWSPEELFGMEMEWDEQIWSRTALGTAYEG